MNDLTYKITAAIIDSGEIGFNGPKNADSLLSSVLGAVYFWMAVVAVGFIIYGGFMYMISAGEPGKLKKAKDVLLYAIIGIVVVMVAFVITNFVIQGV